MTCLTTAAKSKGFVWMEKRSVQEISLEMRHNLVKLVDATIRVRRAEKERTTAIIKLLKLQKEMEGATGD